MYLPAANSLGLSTNGTNAVYIDSSQNVGIGTTSPSYKLDVNGVTRVSGLRQSYQTGLYTVDGALSNYSSTNGVYLNGNGSGWLSLRGDGNGSTRIQINGSSYTEPDLMAFFTNTSERMRIDSSGFLLVGGTSSVSSTAKIQSFSNAGNSGTGYIGMFASGSSLANQNVGFQIGQTDLRIYGAWDGSGNARNNVYVSAQSNGVQLSSGGTSWSAISDERQKDIIEPIENGLTKVASLRAVIGKYKTDHDDVRRIFLIAQDVQAVLPEAISTDGNGKLGLNYQDLVPVLVKAIQEQQALITALTARITALENK
jgi:hypothetical protein